MALFLWIVVQWRRALSWHCTTEGRRGAWSALLLARQPLLLHSGLSEAVEASGLLFLAGCCWLGGQCPPSAATPKSARDCA